jgi:hypothetical protein
MPMTFTLLNLTSNPQAPSAKLEIDPRLGTPTSPVINDPASIPTDDPLILYILGHAIPNGLMGPKGTIPEADLFAQIEQKRRGRKTLLIWDVCFAESFLVIAQQARWPDNYVNIYACQGYERTWNNGNLSHRNWESLFSKELANALAKYDPLPPPSWDDLQADLRQQLAGVQTPQIVYGVPVPSDFPISVTTMASLTVGALKSKQSSPRA